MEYNITISSTMEKPMPEWRRRQYAKTIIANTYIEALEKYKQLLDPIIPRGFRYKLQVKDTNGQEYGKDQIFWDKR